MRTLFKRLFMSLAISLVFVGTATRFEGALGSGSYVAYAARTASHAWEGRAPIKALTLSFDDAAPNSNLDLEITLDAASFQSGNFARDINARRTVFETERYPEISLTAKRLSGGAALSEDGEYELELSGTLTMHGVTRDLRTPLTLTRRGPKLLVKGSFEVLLSDYEMQRPSLFGNAVEDTITVSYSVEAALEPSKP